MLAARRAPASSTATRRPFGVLAKPSGPACNLSCRYCFYLEKAGLYPGATSFAMSEEVLDVFIRQYIEAQPAQVVSFVWQGGEPTLAGVEFFERAIALQHRYADGRRIENALQTNGILLDDRWGAFLAEHGFLVGLSIDGPAELHDRFRRDRGGQPTFTRVMRGLEVLRRHGVQFNTLTAVSDSNARQPIDVYRFLKDIGSRYLQFIPIVERVAGTSEHGDVRLAGPEQHPVRVSSWSVDPSDYGRFLCAVFDEWVRRDVGSVFVQQFEVALESWSGIEPSLCVFQKTCGRSYALEHNGDLYPCDHYVYPQFRVGNITTESLAEMAESLQARFGEAKRDRLPRQCTRCDVRFACHGGCPKHRFVRSRGAGADLNYLCGSYLQFFHHIDPYMRFMHYELAHGREPVGVMRWTAARDIATALASVGRNDPCPCGSGRKVKRCCGRRDDR